MADITKTESKFLNELIKDCITYGLEEKEALQYLEIRFKAISLSSYKHRKAKVLSEDASQIWLNHFTRVGFVSAHRQHIEAIEKLQQDSLRQFFVEKIKSDRDEDKIFKLKEDIRSNVKLLSELNLGTPIISAIKSKLEDAKTIQTR